MGKFAFSAPFLSGAFEVGNHSGGASISRALGLECFNSVLLLLGPNGALLLDDNRCFLLAFRTAVSMIRRREGAASDKRVCVAKTTSISVHLRGILCSAKPGIGGMVQKHEVADKMKERAFTVAELRS
jgi:hypothetical protein